MTPIGLAKFVTNAIMKNSANMIAMAKMFPPSFFSILIVFSLFSKLLTYNSQLLTYTRCAPSEGSMSAQVGSSPYAAL